MVFNLCDQRLTAIKGRTLTGGIRISRRLERDQRLTAIKGRTLLINLDYWVSQLLIVINALRQSKVEHIPFNPMFCVWLIVRDQRLTAIKGRTLEAKHLMIYLMRVINALRQSKVEHSTQVFSFSPKIP